MSVDEIVSSQLAGKSSLSYKTIAKGIILHILRKKVASAFAVNDWTIKVTGLIFDRNCGKCFAICEVVFSGAACGIGQS